MTKRRDFIKKGILGTTGLTLGSFHLHSLHDVMRPSYLHSQNFMNSLPAFPGAEGEGAVTPGGRGGKVYKITSLKDYSENETPLQGSLRHAIEQDGPRTVVFGIAGTIRLKQNLIVNKPYLTVAGNTAPFPGITIRGYQTSVQADHVILRYLRFRPDISIMRERFSKGLDSGWDCINGSRCEYVIFDHLSGSHSVDEVISFSGEVDRVIISNCISAYSLRSIFHDYYFSRGPNYQHTQHHNLGGLLAYLGKHDRHATAIAHHNIYANHDRRMPGLSAGRNDPENLMSFIDIRNNLMYNWKSNAAGIETGSVERSRYYVNLIANYFIPGPETPKENRYAGLKVMGYNRVYLKANVHSDFVQKNEDTPQQLLLDDRGKLTGSKSRILHQPLPQDEVTTSIPPSLKDIANDRTGASLPCRDNVDALVFRDIKNGTGYFPFADMDQDDSPPVPDLPEVRHVYATVDDVFPVWWKLSQGLSADAKIDPLSSSGDKAYTNIEKYMYGIPVDSNVKATSNAGSYAEISLLEKKTGDKPRGWSDRDKNETIFASPGGIFIFASSVAGENEKNCGCGNIFEEEGYWSPGKDNNQITGVEGAGNERGPALVFAFPVPQNLKAIQIAKKNINAYPGDHDPRHVVLQGLEGWPFYWTDLTGSLEIPAFNESNREHRIKVPSEGNALFSAYRLIFLDSRGDVLRIQSLNLLI